MIDNKKAPPGVDGEIVAKAREIIIGVSPIEFLRPHEPEALAEGALSAVKPADISPAELTELIAQGDDLEEDIRKLINAKKLQAQLSGISFNPRETELIGKAFLGTTVFIEQVVLPLLRNRDEYCNVWLLHGNRPRPWQSTKEAPAKKTDKPEEEDNASARAILSHLASEAQLKDPENMITPLILETLARLLPLNACEEFTNLLKTIILG